MQGEIPIISGEMPNFAAKKMEDVEFQYFIDNQRLLFGCYPNQYLVIQGTKVVTVGSDWWEAYMNAQKEGLLQGEYIIQLCGPDEKCYTVEFNQVGF